MSGLLAGRGRIAAVFLAFACFLSPLIRGWPAGRCGRTTAWCSWAFS
jgi:hypothetical protein